MPGTEALGSQRCWGGLLQAAGRAHMAAWAQKSGGHARRNAPESGSAAAALVPPLLALSVWPAELSPVPRSLLRRADVAAAVRLAQTPESPYLGGKGSEEGRRLGFFVPPPFAIAHHLLKVWVERGPWFHAHDSAGAAVAAQSSL